MYRMTLLLERLRPRIERLGGGGHDGEDLYAEVALACVEKRNKYDWADPSIEGRIIQIAKNLRNTLLRRESTRTRNRLCMPTDALEDSTASCAPLGIASRCEAAMDELPDRYRQVIHERFIKGKPLVVIAEEQGTPSATIRTRCRRALQQLARDPRMQSLAQDYGMQT